MTPIKKESCCLTFNSVGVHSFSCPVRDEDIHISISKNEHKEEWTDREIKTADGGSIKLPPSPEYPEEWEERFERLHLTGMTTKEFIRTELAKARVNGMNEACNYITQHSPRVDTGRFTTDTIIEKARSNT